MFGGALPTTTALSRILRRLPEQYSMLPKEKEMGERKDWQMKDKYGL
jgi:hypothetical protein